jgi:hypothetical protein
MERDLKFRVWDGEKMFYVKGSAYIKLYEDHSGAVVFVGPYGAEEEICRIRSFTPVMQYVGLKDRSRKDIYEGDIVNDRVQNCIVEWNSREAKFNLAIIYDEIEGICQTHKPFPLDANGLTVIGNIHDVNQPVGGASHMKDPNIKPEETQQEAAQESASQDQAMQVESEEGEG